ncbi:Mu transposase C-terminal domain-containing protein [Xanthomonas arboricola]|uniref:Mu transposase C-terminal domain-containing protein n=1 Tax=Xanthomonas arboricola TaxID=56448 RepID=UPI00201A0898|nr:Mu transposase C-terminal domain-containing protein [Xanthomonas arboricola]UQQ16512.1 DDE-type integrase/transposase/recombinase [Xanthomonas arboricola pv. corylina]
MTRTSPPQATFALYQGAEVLHRGQPGFVTHVLDLESVLIRDAASGEVARARISDLMPPATGTTTARPDLEEIPDEDWRIAQRRLEIIRPLAGRRDRTRIEVSIRAKEFGMTAGTLYAWLSAYESTDRLTALLPQRRSDKGALKLSAEVEAIVQSAIEDVYLSSQRRPIIKVCETVRERCLTAGLETPHPNTVRNRIARMSESFRVKRRYGAKTAEQQFAPSQGTFPGADWPLAVVQIDHTKLDIILVDDLHRRPISRPWITLAIDVFSRMVTGFYVSFDPPGALATGLCIAQAVLPKEQWLAKHDLDAEWPVWGFPKNLHLDNAKEFRGNTLQKACAEYGIDISWRPVARPHFGGHIERLLGTLLKEIHTLPGTTFSNPRERGEYDADAKAALTLREFESWLTTYIAKVYHQRLHSALSTTPLAKYREGVFGTAQRPGTGLPPRIADEQRLRLDFMPYVERTIQDYGVVIDEIHYYHDVLRRWIGAKEPGSTARKRKFLFRRDPRDISSLWFYDPELRTYFDIPYRDTSHPAISLWELREVQRLAEEAGKTGDERSLFEAYERMRAIEAQAQSKTRSARLAQQRRRDGLGAARSTTAASVPTIETPTSSEPDIRPFDELDDLTHD